MLTIDLQNKLRAALIGGVLLLGPAPGAATEVYVAPAGNDANPGTAAAPVATLKQALQLVRAARAAGAQDDVVVRLRSGEYFLNEPLHFDANDTAPEGHVTTFAAESDSTVIVSGGQPIIGWTQVGEVFTTTIDDVRAGRWRFRELFINGRRATRARTPNEGYYRVVEPGPDRRTSFRFEPGQLEAWSDAANAELIFFHDWSTSQVKVKAVDPASQSVTLAAPIGRAMPHYEIAYFEPHPRYYVENVAALLDSPGEWHLDESTGVLRYWPRAGETLENLTAIAPRLEQLVTVRGERSGCQFVAGLQFVGMTFSHCAWQPPSTGLAMGQASVYEDRAQLSPTNKSPQAFIPAAVSLDLVRDCAFEDCRFEHLGGTALEFRETCLDNRIAACQFRDLAANAINIGETFTRGGRMMCLPVDEFPNSVSRRNQVIANTIEKCGQLYPSGVGIWIGMAAETLIERNQVRDLPYAGISLGWSWADGDAGCRDNAVRDNHIHHVMLVLSDAGGIYTLGNQPGTVIERNRIHDIPANAGQAQSNGMFFDESSAYFRVTGNSLTGIVKSPLRFHRAHDVFVADNLVECAADTPPWKFEGCTEAQNVIGVNQVRAALSTAGPEKAASVAD